MRKSRFSEEQIVSALKEAATGVPVRDICSQIGISEPMFYGWRRKFCTLDESGVRRVRQLEKANQRLKSMMSHQLLQLEAESSFLKEAVGRLSLDISALKMAVVSGELRTNKENENLGVRLSSVDLDELEREKDEREACPGA